MCEELQVANGHSIKPAAQLVSKTIVPVQTVSSDDQWFRNAVRVLLPKDAGLALSLFTGSDERSCYRYARGERDPTLAFFRTLVHTEHGEPFHGAFMDGCKARWWLEQQTWRAKADDRDKISQIINGRG